MDQGDHVVAHARRKGRGEHSGLEISDKVIQVFTFEGEKCVRVHEFYDHGRGDEVDRRRERRVTDLRGGLVRAACRTQELTAQERRLELVLRLFSLLFAAFVIGYLLQGLLGPAEFPFVANSVAKDGMFAVLAFIAAGDIRQNGWAGPVGDRRASC